MALLGLRIKNDIALGSGGPPAESGSTVDNALTLDGDQITLDGDPITLEPTEP